MKSKRIQWLDFAKGITMLSVVIIHSLCPPLISYVLDIFAMPLFFAILGYLYKQINTWYKYKLMIYKKKFISLGIPYAVFTFFILEDILIKLCIKLSGVNYYLVRNNIFRFRFKFKGGMLFL